MLSCAAPGFDLSPGPVISSATSDYAGNVHPSFGRGICTKAPSILLCDYVTHTVVGCSPYPAPLPFDHSSGTPYPIAHYSNCDSYTKKYRAFLATIISIKELGNFKEAMRNPNWRRVMQEEIQALKANGTWRMQYLLPYKRILGS